MTLTRQILRSTTAPLALLANQRRRDGSKIYTDHAWLISQAPPNLNLSSLARTAYIQDNAQAIRNGAGNNAPVGTSGAVGVVGTPVSRTWLAITQESDISGLASSGDGSEANPYIVELLEINDPATGFCVQFADADADYFVEFHNCIFADSNFYTIWVNSWGNTPAKFVNCDIWSDVSGGTGYLARHEEENTLIFENCHFKGGPDARLIGIVGTGDTIIDNCRFDETEQAFANNTSMVQMINANGGDITIRNSTFVASANTGLWVVRNSTNSFGKLIFENNDVQGFQSVVNGAFANAPEIVGAVIRNNKIVDTRQEAILYGNATDWIIEYNDFQHNTEGSGYRLVYLTGDNNTTNQDIDGVIARYNKFTKKTGSQSAGNECLQFATCKNCVMEYNWITECPEDGYELVNLISGNIIANNVADNCAGQAVDCFFQWNENDWESYVDTTNAPDSLTYVHNIYGDSGDFGVVCQGIVGFYGHDIYVETGTTFGTVRIRDDGTQTGRISRKVRFAGAFALDADTGSAGQFSIQALDTIDVEGRYIDENGDLQIVLTQPSDIKNLVMWLDPSDSSTISDNGGTPFPRVNQLNDKSGQGNNATASGANRPFTDDRTINGLNVLDYQGTEQMGVTNDADFDHATDGFTLIQLAAFDTADLNAIEILAGKYDTFGTREWLLGNLDATNGIYGNVSADGGNTTPFDTNIPTDTDPHLFFYRYGGDGTKAQIGWDSATPKAESGVVNMFEGAVNVSIGNTPSGTFGLDGMIGEILYFNRALTDDELNTIARYINNKWGEIWPLQ